MNGIGVVAIGTGGAVVAQLLKSVELVHSFEYATHIVSEAQVGAIAAVAGLALWGILRRQPRVAAAPAAKPKPREAKRWFLNIRISGGRKR